MSKSRLLILSLVFLVTVPTTSAGLSPRAKNCLLLLAAGTIVTPMVVAFVPHHWYAGSPVPEADLEARISEVGASGWLSAVGESLTVEQLVEFGENGSLPDLLPAGQISIGSLEQLRGELRLPLRWNQMDRTWYVKDEASEVVGALVFAMELAGKSSVSKDELLREMRARMTELEGKGEIGHVYRLVTIRYPRLLMTWSQPLVVSRETQDNVVQAFERGREDFLSDQERRYLEEGVYSREELSELRGIKKAFEILERASVVNGIPRGGFWNNVKAELLGGNRQLCGQCQLTAQEWVEEFIDLGLVTNVSALSKVVRDWGFDSNHVALRVTMQSGREFVVDSWFEDGGTAPRILTLKDWEAKRDSHDLVSLLED